MAKEPEEKEKGAREDKKVDGKESLTDRLMRTFEAGARTFEKMVEDAADALGPKIEEMGKGSQAKLEEAFSDATFKEFYGTVVKYMKQGKEATKAKLEELGDKYYDQLEKMKKEKPQTVGFIDGFVQVYTNRDANRSRTKAYVQAVGVGKTIGWLSATYLFIAGGIISKAVSLIPAAARSGNLMEYIKRKTDEVRAEMNKEKYRY